MSVMETWWRRPGLIARLVEKAPGLGRTAIMKLPYLLQTLRDVPLGYDFRLYTYGPFDADVLNDLAYAEAVGAVTEETVYFTNGYGYQVRPGPRCAEVQALAADWLAQYEDEIDWAVGEFAGGTAAELELISTIIFVDRDIARQGHSAPLRELARRVSEVKPHFAEEHVLAKCRGGKVNWYLKAVEGRSVRPVGYRFASEASATPDPFPVRLPSAPPLGEGIWPPPEPPYAA